ncbi:MAG: bifunctional metallophosphatase/5'-nucleotidase [Spirochaetes bacterium]|nr:bifunctional metallophosphatase/5'-nucleotidase [Spirochaetota bacterium]
MKMTDILIIAVLLCLPLSLYGKERTLTVVHTNDMHSHLLGYPPTIDYTPMSTGDDGTAGGWARIATVIRQIRAERSNPVLLVDGGDFLMGTLFHVISRERSVELGLMREMGYDMITLGNHEFDLRPAGLARILRAAERNGGLPPMVASNVIFDPTDDRDNTLEEVFRSGLVRPYRVVVKDGITVGFFGLMGKNAAEVAPFATPVTFGDPVAVAREMTALLREKEKVDVIICLSHSGLVPGKPAISEDVKLARKVPGIDIIISAHTHTPLARPIVEGDTVIVQAWYNGKWVGVLDLSLDAGRPALKKYRIIEINDTIRGDARLTSLIDGNKGEISRALLAPLGLAFDSIIAETAFDLAIGEDETNLGNLIADASRWYVNRFAYDPHDPATRVAVAFDSNGLIRDPVAKGKTGKVGVCDLFSALPLGIGEDDTIGYPMVAVYLNAAEIKKALEVATSIYPLRGGDYFLQVSGLRYRYNPYRMIFDRVTGIDLGDETGGYRPLDYSESNRSLYRITANMYNATFLKIVGDFTLNILNIVPKDRNGKPIKDLAEALVDADPDRPGVQEVKQWVGLVEYVRGFRDLNGNGRPDIPGAYRAKLGRILSEPSLCPVALLKRGNWLTWIGFGIVIGACAVVAVAAIVVVRKIRK